MPGMTFAMIASLPPRSPSRSGAAAGGRGFAASAPIALRSPPQSLTPGWLQVRRGRAATAKATSHVCASFGAPKDPFAAGQSPPGTVQPPSVADGEEVVEGFLNPQNDRDSLMSVEEAHTLLRAFNTFQLKGKEAVSGKYGPPGATEQQVAGAKDKLRAACVAMAASSGLVMLGICGPSQGGGVEALKGWVPGLGLPRGRLHGMDKDGVPIQMAGAVYIKYNAKSGDADLSGYGGMYRGVLFTPQLPDGEFRQYGYLPLNLFVD